MIHYNKTSLPLSIVCYMDKTSITYGYGVLSDFERLQKARREKRKQDMQAVPIMVNDNQIIKDKK